jgi:hypothetical protein
MREILSDRSIVRNVSKREARKLGASHRQVGSNRNRVIGRDSLKLGYRCARQQTSVFSEVLLTFL